MAELFSNAFEHGVLGLDSKLKSSADGFAQYYQQRETAMANMQDDFVRFEFDLKPKSNGIGGQLTITVEDSGKGFDYKNVQNSTEGNLGYSGRGIPLISSLCDSLKYYGCGNKVEVVLSWETQIEE